MVRAAAAQRQPLHARAVLLPGGHHQHDRRDTAARVRQRPHRRKRSVAATFASRKQGEIDDEVNFK